MTSAHEIAAVLSRTQNHYLTHRNQYAGRSLHRAQAEAVTQLLQATPNGGGPGQPRTPVVPNLHRRLVLLCTLIGIAAASDEPQPWEDLIHAACDHPGDQAPTEAEYAAMATRPLIHLLEPEPPGTPRLVWPYCPHPHQSGQPERLHRVNNGWLCGGHTPHGDPCPYETSPTGQPALTEGASS